jgi:hypothetical protein
MRHLNFLVVSSEVLSSQLASLAHVRLRFFAFVVPFWGFDFVVENEPKPNNITSKPTQNQSERKPEPEHELYGSLPALAGLLFRPLLGFSLQTLVGIFSSDPFWLLLFPTQLLVNFHRKDIKYKQITQNNAINVIIC